MAAQSVVQRGIQLQFIHGLAHEIIGAGLHGFDHQGIVGNTGYHDYRRCFRFRLDFLQQIQAVTVGKLLVQKDDVRRGPGKKIAGLVETQGSLC